MRGEGLILAVLGLAGLGFAGMFLKRAIAAPVVPPVPPEPPVPPVPPAPPGEAILVAAAEATASVSVEAIAVS